MPNAPSAIDARRRLVDLAQGYRVTGVDMLNTELDGKRLELLLAALPRAKKVAVAIHDSSRWTDQLKPVRATADRVGVQLVVVDVGERDPTYAAAFESMRRTNVDGVLFPSSPLFNRDRHTIIDLAARYRLPAIYELPTMAQDGGLMAYAASIVEMDRQVAAFVDKILKGAKPGDLPIEQPTKFEFAINLKTARALNLAIPPSLLLRADQVIE